MLLTAIGPRQHPKRDFRKLGSTASENEDLTKPFIAFPT